MTLKEKNIMTETRIMTKSDDKVGEVEGIQASPLGSSLQKNGISKRKI